MDDDQHLYRHLPGCRDISAARSNSQANSSPASLPPRPLHHMQHRTFHTPALSMPAVNYADLTPEQAMQSARYLEGAENVYPPPPPNRSNAGGNAMAGSRSRIDEYLSHAPVAPPPPSAPHLPGTNPSRIGAVQSLNISIASSSQSGPLTAEQTVYYQRYAGGATSTLPTPASTGIFARARVAATANFAATTSQTQEDRDTSAWQEDALRLNLDTTFATGRNYSIGPRREQIDLRDEDEMNDEAILSADVALASRGTATMASSLSAHDLLSARLAILTGRRDTAVRLPPFVPATPRSITTTSPSYANSKEFLAQGIVKHDFITTPSDFVTPSYTTDHDCPICYETYGGKVTRSNEDAVRITACGHVLGRKCLETHVASGQLSSRLCPMCRGELWRRGVPANNSFMSTRYMREMTDRMVEQRQESLAERRMQVDELRTRTREALQRIRQDITDSMDSRQRAEVETAVQRIPQDREALQTMLTEGRARLDARLEALASEEVTMESQPIAQGLPTRPWDERTQHLTSLEQLRAPRALPPTDDAAGETAVSAEPRATEDAATSQRILQSELEEEMFDSEDMDTYYSATSGMDIEDVDMLLEQAVAMTQSSLFHGSSGSSPEQSALTGEQGGSVPAANPNDW